VATKKLADTNFYDNFESTDDLQCN